MKYLIIIILGIACNAKSQINQQVDSYLTQGQPYKISTLETHVILPDSLRPKNFHEGQFGINYFVDSKGRIEGVNLGLLRLKNASGERIIWYRNKNTHPTSKDYYPIEIQPYLNWAYDYSTTRKIEKIDEVDNDLKWSIWVLPKLK